jgi:hypothetical protein
LISRDGRKLRNDAESNDSRYRMVVQDSHQALPKNQNRP